MFGWTDVLDQYNGIHKYMGWDRSILTDSGGFQMVSLVHLTKLSEEGVEFAYPHNQDIKLMMTPEESMRIQKSINSDIVMQLDDVVSAGRIKVTVPGAKPSGSTLEP